MPAGILELNRAPRFRNNHRADRYLSHNFQRSRTRVTLSHGIYLPQRNLIGALVLNCSRWLTNWYHRSVATFESGFPGSPRPLRQHRSLFLSPLRHFLTIPKELLWKRFDTFGNFLDDLVRRFRNEKHVHKF